MLCSTIAPLSLSKTAPKGEKETFSEPFAAQRGVSLVEDYKRRKKELLLFLALRGTEEAVDEGTRKRIRYRVFYECP